MNVLITGGAGFVGSNLVRKLQGDLPNANLLVIDDFRSGSFANLSDEQDGFSYHGQLIARSVGDVDLHAVIEQFEPEVIYHQASITDTTVMDQAKMIRDNVEPFDVLLEAAVQRGIKLVWASSAATYGIQANGATAQRRPLELTDAGSPANVYGFSKWLMENRARQVMAAHPEAHLVGLRYFNVFGPGEAHKKHMASMVYQLAQQMLAGKRPRIFHDGEQSRDHVYVKDVVDCTVAGAHDAAKPGIYNVGTGTATSFNAIVDVLNEALGTDRQAEYFENPYTFYQDYTCADVSQTRAGLGWSPAHRTRGAMYEYARWLSERARA